MLSRTTIPNIDKLSITRLNVVANRNPSDKSFQRLGGALNSPGTVKADQLPVQKCFCLPGFYLGAVEIDDWAERV